METQPIKPSKPFSINWGYVVKIFLIIAFLPIVAVWYIWEKTSWSKRSKWIGTVVILAIVLFFVVASNNDKQAVEKNKETQALKAQVIALQSKLEQEKQKNNSVDVENIPSAVADNNQLSQLYDVLSVTDGDTIKVNINGSIEPVRLIGIDTPETVDPRKPVQCFGKEASNRAKEILTNKKITLEADGTQGDRDQYGRLLRYVFLEDGTFFNKKMIEDGFAHEYTYDSKPYRYQTEFKDAEKLARTENRGLWAPETCNGDTQKAASSDSATAAVAPQVIETQVESVASQSSVSSGIVKKSSTGICHAPGTTYYEKTKTFISFDSIEQCLSSGGRLPKG